MSGDKAAALHEWRQWLTDEMGTPATAEGINENEITKVGKAILSISFETVDESIEGAADLAISLGHESFIHNEGTNAVMSAASKGDFKTAIGLAKKAEDKSGASTGGDGDHKRYITNTSKATEFNFYVNNLKKLAK